ncbi:MAG: T9SS type A sorting domain-containing protein [bacterium]|nr:T9SS type A sorting domain-containing protein [bacterium]
MLHACYPNPFNSSVTIPLEVTGPESQHVTLTIANTLVQIAYSFSQTDFTPGLHTLRWNGSDAATGLYFVTAHSHNARHIQKILLIK